MISLINGIVRSISSDRAVVEVGGVGLAVSLTSQTTAQLNSRRFSDPLWLS
jgi:holliday junction DNA helicase RuvA